MTLNRDDVIPVNNVTETEPNQHGVCLNPIQTSSTVNNKPAGHSVDKPGKVNIHTVQAEDQPTHTVSTAGEGVVLKPNAAGEGRAASMDAPRNGAYRVITPAQYPAYISALWPWPTVEAIEKFPECMKLYNAVRSENKPNYLGARVPVPSDMCCDEWDRRLARVGDPRVGGFLRYGWPTCYGAPSPPQATYKNHDSATQYASSIDDFIVKELSLGGLVGPFNAPPFQPWCQISPLMTQPKKDSKKRRVIIDLSFPAGRGVNSGIGKNVYEGEPLRYTLPSILTLADRVRKLGQGSYMWKHDLSRAYRQSRICPLSFPLLGIRHRGLYYIDVCPAFGCRVSGCSQQRVSESLCAFMGEEGHTILAYVDDFCGVSASHDAASKAFHRFESLCEELGMALAEEKSAPPSQCMEWLGFELNSIDMTLKVPQSKLDDILKEAGQWEKKVKANKSEIQSVAGKFSHISQCIPHSRKFMNRILANLRVTSRTGWVTVSEGLRSDVRWFVEFARQFNGVLLIPPSFPKVVLEVDACLQGGGGFSDKGYYKTRYPIQTQIDHHIARLEAMNAITALETLVPSDKRCVCVLIRTDNSAAAAVLMTGRTHDPVLAACARELATYAGLRQLQIIVTHVPGISLVLADALSRYTLSKRYENIANKRIATRNLTEVKAVDLLFVLNSVM